MNPIYLRQTISAYATEGEEFSAPRENYVLVQAELVGTKWALIWAPREVDDEDEEDPAYV